MDKKKSKTPILHNVKHKMKDGLILDSVKGYKPIFDNIPPEAAQLIVQIIMGETPKN